MHNSLILTYHNIVDGKSNDLLLYDVSLDDFRQQMEYLRQLADEQHKVAGSELPVTSANTPFIYESEYEVRNPKHVTTNSKPETRNSLKYVITFDDGYHSWAKEVLADLLQHGLKAIFFVCIKHIEEGKISCVDILKLKNAGMEIGSHSVSHSYLDTLSETELFTELGESKKALESITQAEVKYFSVPYGNCSERIVKIAQAIGYQAVFTSVIGINQRAGYTLKRVSLKRDTSLTDFKEILAGKRIGRMAFEQGFKDTIKRIVGVKNFHFFRNCIVRKAE